MSHLATAQSAPTIKNPKVYPRRESFRAPEVPMLKQVSTRHLSQEELAAFPEHLRAQVAMLIEARVEKAVYHALKDTREDMFELIDTESERTNALLKDRVTTHVTRAEGSSHDDSKALV